jgi:multiple sugar transport system substrate-binding protein
MTPLRTALATLAAAVMLVSGCGSDSGSGSGGATAKAGGPVSLLVFGAPEELGAYRTLAEAYEKATPGSEVKLIEASDRSDLIARLSTSIAGGSPPDLFLMNYRF